MSLQSRLSGRLVQLRAAGQLLVPPRPRPGHLAGATRTRSSTCCPPAFLGVFGRSARTSAGVGAWGAAAVGRTAGVRTWAPLAMAAKVDLSTSTDWKEAKCKCKHEGARGRGRPHVGLPGWAAPIKRAAPSTRETRGKLRPHLPWNGPLLPIHSHPRPLCVPSPTEQFTPDQVQVSMQGAA